MTHPVSTERAVMPPPETPSTPQVPPRRRNSHRRAVIILSILAAVILFAAGALVASWYLEQRSAKLTSRTVPATDGNTLSSSTETTIANVVEKASPSVVSILTTVDAESYWTTYEQVGAGTGFIVSADGVILTNKHVIDGAKTLRVIAADGTEYTQVDTLLVDPLNDLAFLKLRDARDLPVLELGDSSTVKIGQTVIAIGNSLGEYQNTVTSGIISGTNRPLTASGGAGNTTETLTDLLQTDAAINPGNSGGPLFNASGQVIGINTAIAADAEGIGFSIPINAAKGILKQILAGNSSPARAYLGVRYIPVNAAVAKQYELGVTHGAYVSASSSSRAVVVDSPADKAGIRDGDVITKINDVEVGPRGGVSSLVSEYAPGDTIRVELQRGADTRTVSVTLVAFDS